MADPHDDPDDLEPTEAERDVDEPVACFGPELDYAYDPGAAEWMAS